MWGCRLGSYTQSCQVLDARKPGWPASAPTCTAPLVPMLVNFGKLPSRLLSPPSVGLLAPPRRPGCPVPRPGSGAAGLRGASRGSEIGASAGLEELRPEVRTCHKVVIPRESGLHTSRNVSSETKRTARFWGTRRQPPLEAWRGVGRSFRRERSTPAMPS